MSRDALSAALKGGIAMTSLSVAVSSISFASGSVAIAIWYLIKRAIGPEPGAHQRLIPADLGIQQVVGDLFMIGPSKAIPAHAKPRPASK